MAKDDTKTQERAEPCIAVARFDDGQKFMVPTRSYEGDAGLDLYVSRYIPVAPRTRARIPHNITIALPPGFYGQIVPRSSTLFDLGLIVIPGVIDRDFRGEVQTMVFNPMGTTIIVNDSIRISQLLIHKLHQHELREMPREKLLKDYPSLRGEKGFGSTNPARRKG